MTDTKHTKGHWTVYTGHDGQFKYRPYIITHVGRGVLPVVIAVTCDIPERDANAALLAAAPELLDALEDCALWITANISAMAESTGGNLVEKWLNENKTLQKANAAIAKTKGE
jgi:hypothetical protein